MTHSPAFGCRLAGNKTYHRFLIATFFDVTGCFGFHAAADFPDHHDTLGFGVVHQHFHGLFGGGSDDRVSPDTDGRGLPQAYFGQLVYGFIGKRT
ncbi:hypothetical protein D9M70_640210 [compost metagenome]